MSVNFEHYKIFYYVAEYGNITRAAEKLCLTQPTVTKQIQNLEADLDCQLFERSKSGVSLTTEGRALFQRIRPACATLVTAEETIELRRAMQYGSLRICSGLTPLRIALLPALHTFRERYPRVTIFISDNRSDTRLTDLENGVFDILFDLAPADLLSEEHMPDSANRQNLVVRTLQISRDIAVASPAFAGVFQNPLTFDTLASLPLIFRKIDTTASGFYHFLYHQKLSGGDSSYMVADFPQGRIELALNGMGVCFVPPEFVRGELARGELIEVPVTTPLLERRFVAVTQKRSRVSQATKKFLEILTQQPHLGTQHQTSK